MAAPTLKPDEVPKLVLNADSLAMLFGVTPQSVYVWARAGMPKASPGKYPVAECIQWRIKELTATMGTGLEDERKRLIMTQRERAEIENAKLKSELLPAEEVATLLQQLGVIFTTQMQGLGPRLAQRVAAVDDPAVVQTVISDECTAIRAATSAAVQDFASAHGGFADTGTAASPQRRRVGKRKPRATARKSGAGKVAHG